MAQRLGMYKLKIPTIVLCFILELPGYWSPRPPSFDVL